MQNGVDELEAWLLDLTRQGLASLDGRQEDYFEELATRMVNAKLGGLANRIRQFKYLFEHDEWHETLFQKLLSLYLYTQAFKQLAQLPVGMQAELLRFGGVNVDKSLLSEQKGVIDKWLVLAQRFSSENNLNARRTWIYGEKSSKIALLLDHEFGHTNFKPPFQIGYIYKGELNFFPGVSEYRALLKEPVSDNTGFQGKGGYPTFSHFLKTYATALQKNPWFEYFPCLLNEVSPYYKEGLWLSDKLQQRLPVKPNFKAFWKLIALSMDHPLSLFGLWNGFYFSPLAAFSNNRIIPLEIQ